MKDIKIFALTLIVILATVGNTTFAASRSVFPSGVGVATVVNRYNNPNNNASNNSNTSTTAHNPYITFDGRYFKDGDQVHVYSNSDTTYQIGVIPLPFNQYLDDVVVSLPTLTQSSGSLYVTLTDAAGDAESEPLKVDYVEEVTVTNNVDIPDTVKFTGLIAKDIAKVYDSPVAGKTLGTATATIDGDVVVSLSAKLLEPLITESLTSPILVYVTVKSTGGVESVRTPVSYSRALITVAPVGNVAVATSPADIVVGNNLTTPDTITFLNLKAKDVVNIYAPGAPANSYYQDPTLLPTSVSTIQYAKDKTVTINPTIILGTATATKDGSVVVKLAKQLSEADKRIYVSVKNYNLHESAVTLVQYYRAGETPTTDPSNLAVTITPSTYNMITTSNMVFVSGVNANDIVTVYDSGNNKLIGMATVASGNTYVVVNFISTSNSIYLKNKNTDKLISDSSSLITLQ